MNTRAVSTYKKSDPLVTARPKYETLLLAFLAIVVILIYADTLTGPFILDDIDNIVANPHIRISSLDLKDIIRAGFQSPEANRPVANISFALNYYFNGLNRVGFHVVNILIHILAGIFLYFFVQSTLHTPMLQARFEQYGWVAFLTAFIWLVHPLQTQSVAYLVQRMNSLAAMFYILSMLLYVRFRLNRTDRRNWLLLAGCVLAGLLAVGTKQICATLPVFIILYEWYFFQKLSFNWTRRHFIVLFCIVLVLVIIALIFLGQDPIVRIISAYRYRDFTLPQRVLTQSRVVIFYLGLLLWPRPSNLNLDHDFALSYSLTNPMTTLISMGIIAALIGLAILSAKREPLLSFGIFWFFGNLVIESSVIGLELVFEHRNYLPSMVLILAIVALVLRYVKPIWLGAAFLCLVGMLFTVWTFERNKIWSDELSLYRDCAVKSPAKARARNNYGSILLRRNRLPEAVNEFKTAVSLKPKYADAHYNLANALVKQGHSTEGIYHYSQTIRLRPRDVKALNNLAATLVIEERYAEAIDYLKKALIINPADPNLHTNLGIILKREGNLVEAGHHFSRALEINPYNESARHGLAEIERRGQEAGGTHKD